MPRFLAKGVGFILTEPICMGLLGVELSLVVIELERVQSHPMLNVGDACLKFGEGGFVLGGVGGVVADKIELGIISIKMEVCLV